MPIALLLLIAGIVLIKNAGWFAGAHLVGVILAVAGGLGLAVTLLILLIALVVGAGAAAGSTRKRSRF